MRDFTGLEFGVDDFIKIAQTAPVPAKAGKPQPPAELLSAYKSLPAWGDDMSRGEWLRSLNKEQRAVADKYHDWARSSAARQQAAAQEKSDAEMRARGIVQSKGGFTRNLAKNLASAPARASQIITHGVTDTAAGLADLAGLAHVPGAKSLANGIRGAQNWYDNFSDRHLMSNEMAQAYRDDKVGRAFGDVGSMAIGALIPVGPGGAAGKILGRAGKLLGKIPGASKAVSAVGKGLGAVSKVVKTPAGKLLAKHPNLAGFARAVPGAAKEVPGAVGRAWTSGAAKGARGISRGVNWAGGKLARLAPAKAAPSAVNATSSLGKAWQYGKNLARPVARVANPRTWVGAAGRAMQHVTPEAVQAAGMALSVPAHVVNNDMSHRVGVDGNNNAVNYNEGDVNYVMQAQDWLNNNLNRERARMGNREAMADNLKRMDVFDQLYNRDEFGNYDPTELTVGGRRVVNLAGYDENGNPVAVPQVVRNRLMARRLQREMSDRNAFAASESHGPMATSLVGRLQGKKQPVYEAAPGIDWSKSNRLPTVTPRPVIDAVTGRIATENGTGSDLGDRIATALSYGMYPVTAATNAYDDWHRGNYGAAVGNLAALAAGPAAGKALAGLGAVPAAAGAIGGYVIPGMAGQGAQNLVAPTWSSFVKAREAAALSKLLDEYDRKTRGVVTPGYWNYLE